VAWYPRARVVLSVLLEDFGDGSTSEVVSFEAVPRVVEWVGNTARQADTFRVELDYRDLPLDPRMARLILVTVYCGDVGEPDGEIDLEGDRHLRMLGYVDEPESTMDDSGAVVVLEGRDFTALFLDKRWTGGALDVSRPLSEVVADILDQTWPSGELKIEFAEGTGSTVLKDITGKKRWTPKEDVDTWTVLSDLLAEVSLVPVIRLDTLYVAPAGTVNNLRQAAFLYGENLLKLTFRRELSGRKTEQVELVTWDPQTRESRSATWPAEPIVLTKTLNKDGKVSNVTNAPVARFTLTGSYTVEQLELMAWHIWDERARQQLEGELETLDLVDIEHGTALPELTNGDRVVVEWGTQVLSSIEGMTPGEALIHLTSGPRALTQSVALALIATYAKAGSLASEFYVRSARHSWSRDKGYSLTVDFQNVVGAAT